MKKTKMALGLLILVCGLVLAGGVLAANGPAIERSVFGSGGEQVTDGSLYVLNGTLGEPIASAIALDTDHGLSSGFWWTREFRVYLPLLLRDYS